MTRWLFACLVVLAFVSAPMAAGGAWADCGHGSTAVLHVAMAPGSSMTSKAAPCPQHKTAPAGCAKACDLYGAMSFTLPARVAIPSRFAVEMRSPPALTSALRQVEPAALDPPPKLQA